VPHESVAANKALQEQPIALQQCFTVFTEEEQLANEFVCSACKQSEIMTKRMDFWTLPPILVVQLKRFNGTPVLSKNGKLVQFPIEGLDLAPFTGNPDVGETLYDLVAVLVRTKRPNDSYACHAC